ncbi:zinc finger CCCH domain-containing protein 15 homolog isoform X1 [Penaeus monodon]|uniref:zinc finger CCCH domain-containing protein 15 homolog isoform X1 n=1 Tax=Penaeus monodon TaxID=6687 RepID=UPI0018A70D7C|nr:zinc finger CCCH domain-containing protein 15 homolog isoform X1 [Penaeus monodon]
MPPKNAGKGGGGASKKAEQKKKEKIIEDKTFGIKNKKGAKQQRFIQQVQHQVKHGGNKSARELEKEKEVQMKKKEDKKKELAQLNELFKPVQQLASKGSDPKSILCAFFKQGQCGKGAKCKFSHDLQVERKSEKRSAYVDLRDTEESGGPLDQAALLEMVEKKQGKLKNRPTSEKVCKHFLDAVENSKYGWFWECPNGDTCVFRHALPPGYILKKDRKRMEKEKEEISLEELVDRERAALGPNTTKVTLETFLAWKKRKLKEKEEKEKKEADKKKKDFNAGRNLGLSGREMFTFNPNLLTGGDEMEEGDESFDVHNLGKDPENEEEERFEFKEIDMNSLMSEYQEIDTTASMSVAKPDRLQQLQDEVALAETEANAVAEENAEGATAGAAVAEASVDIDEELFDGDDEDLDDLEEQLEEMTVT